MRAMRRRALLVCLLAVLALAPGRLGANGWEHWGIPRELLLQALDGDQPEYQVAAARSIGHRKEKAAVPRLLDLAGAAGAPTAVRGAAIEALGQIGDAAALPALRRLLEGDANDDIRAEAASALGALGAAEGLPALLKALGERSIAVRTRVVDALGGFRDRRAIEALSGVLDDPRAGGLKVRAIHALGGTGPAAAAPLLRALARAESDFERIAIVDALGAVGAPEAAKPLERLLERAGDNVELRVRVAVALGAISDGSAVPTLIRLLEDPSPAVQLFAIRSLHAAADARAGGPLRRLHEAVLARSRGTDPAAALADPRPYLADATLRLEAMRALIDLDPQASFATFRAELAPPEFPRDSALGLRLNETSYELRRIAIVGLGYSKAGAAAALLADRAQLEDGDFRIRAAAVRALGVVGVADAAERLLVRLDDEAAEVRWETAFVLGRLGDARAAPALAAKLDDAHFEVRRQAALSAGYLGAQAAEAKLRQLAESDPEPAVRAAAATAIGLLAARR